MILLLHDDALDSNFHWLVMKQKIQKEVFSETASN